MAAERNAADGVRFKIDGPIAWITIDNEAEQNRLRPEAVLGLKAIAEKLRANADVHAVVIRGQGADYFCTGILNPALRGALRKDEILDLVFLTAATFDEIEALPQVVIAGLNGAVRAGAVELALACDIRIAAEHVRLSMPEAKWGGFPGAGGPVRLPQLIGRGRAMELVCTGRDIDAEEMLRIGLVERVVASDEFDRALADLAATIARNGPLATRGAKSIMRVRQEPGFRAARELSDALRRALEASTDVDEAIAAHREGRAPRFTGR
ncbi:MAG TPA: enoyl-CoA hydratase/isomerase family protein [Xanthobacteraceae bacterium]|nr:enoyl-CoA hydratase/isomerase family protein [Xanthobacteraceae bacterium]